jgi:hypothetical protein
MILTKLQYMKLYKEGGDSHHLMVIFYGKFQITNYLGGYNE